MVKKFVLLFVFSLICSTFGLDTNYSPVLFFKNKENKNSYPKTVISSTTPINQREFERRISALDQNQKIVFLVTDDLSPEDLSVKNEHKRRAFQNLATGVDIVEYIPYVENAVDNKVTMGKNIVRTTLTSNNELEQKPNDGARIVIVSLPECDESESRYHCMARIDRACFALSTSVEFKDALFVLTSEMNSHLHEAVHIRRARDTSAQAADSKIYKSSNSIVYFKNLMERPKKGTKDAVADVSGAITTLVDKDNLNIQFKGKYDIILHFILDDAQYWTLNASQSTIDGKRIDLQTEVSAPEEFSFSCVSSVYLKFDKDNDLDGIYFQNLQIQLNFTNHNGNLDRFNDSYDCIGFTSPAIWAGLFITFLLLSIISTAITYIMDIRTMDRFDDPKGKTITINASD